MGIPTPEGEFQTEPSSAGPSLAGSSSNGSSSQEPGRWHEAVENDGLWRNQVRLTFSNRSRGKVVMQNPLTVPISKTVRFLNVEMDTSVIQVDSGIAGTSHLRALVATPFEGNSKTCDDRSEKMSIPALLAHRVIAMHPHLTHLGLNLQSTAAADRVLAVKHIINVMPNSIRCLDLSIPEDLGMGSLSHWNEGGLTVREWSNSDEMFGDIGDETEDFIPVSNTQKLEKEILTYIRGSIGNECSHIRLSPHYDNDSYLDRLGRFALDQTLDKKYSFSKEKTNPLSGTNINYTVLFKDVPKSIFKTVLNTLLKRESLWMFQSKDIQDALAGWWLSLRNKHEEFRKKMLLNDKLTLYTCGFLGSNVYKLLDHLSCIDLTRVWMKYLMEAFTSCGGDNKRERALKNFNEHVTPHLVSVSLNKEDMTHNIIFDLVRNNPSAWLHVTNVKLLYTLPPQNGVPRAEGEPRAEVDLYDSLVNSHSNQAIPVIVGTLAIVRQFKEIRSIKISTDLVSLEIGMEWKTEIEDCYTRFNNYSLWRPRSLLVFDWIMDHPLERLKLNPATIPIPDTIRRLNIRLKGASTFIKYKNAQMEGTSKLRSLIFQFHDDDVTKFFTLLSKRVFDVHPCLTHFSVCFQDWKKTKIIETVSRLVKNLPPNILYLDLCTYTHSLQELMPWSNESLTVRVWKDGFREDVMFSQIDSEIED